MKKIPVVVLILMLSLIIVGAGYAAWAKHLGIGVFASSGSFSVVFGQNSDCRVQIVKMDGHRIVSSSTVGVDCDLDNQKKQAKLSFDDTLLLQELAGEDTYLCFSFPLEIDKQSSVQSIVPYQADFSKASQETLELTAGSSTLMVGGTELGAFAPADNSLRWDVYRQVELNGEQLVGTIFLKLVNANLDALNGTTEIVMDFSSLPEEVAGYVVPMDDGTTGRLNGELNMEYSFSVPLYIEQGR